MNTSDFVKLENNKKFKKDYLNKTPWWKTILLISPICFLFLGLAGLLYLFKAELLISYYAIPFIIAFAIGTILLKTIKRHIVNTKMSVPGSFLTCAGKSVSTDSQYAYVVFVTSAQRHYEHYISKLVKNLTDKEVADIKLQTTNKKTVLFHDKESEVSYYAKAFKVKDINKQRKSWDEDDTLPLLFIDEQYIFIINKKYI